MTDFRLGDSVAFDGKTVRGSGPDDHPVRHVVARNLLAPLALRGKMVTADALHTQTKLASFLVKEKHADYVFIVKDNQPSLAADIRAQPPEDFSPSGANLGSGPWKDGRMEGWKDGRMEGWKD
jgi:hypothetical protein